MPQSKFVRTLLIAAGAATALFAVFIIVAGGSKTLDLKPSSAINARASKLAGPAINLTTTAASSIIEKLAPAPGATPTKNSKKAQEAAVSSAVNQIAKSFNPQTFFPVVQDSSLIIASDTSEKAAVEYIGLLLSILKNSSKKIQPDPKDVSLLDFGTALLAYEDAIADLYALPVPRPLVEIHRKAIEIIGAQQNILAVLKNHKADPLQAFLAAQSEELVIDRTTTLHNDINKYLDTLGSQS